jgi:methionine-rich copper-binding protein CopC
MVSRGSRSAAVTLAGVILLAWAAVGHTQTAPGGLEGLSGGAVDAAPVGDPVLARSLRKARLEQTFTIADLNRDGLPDVAVIDFLADSLTVMLGDASGGFGKTTTLATGRGPRSVVAADVNHDGALDLVVGEFLSGFVRVFAGRGDGRFEETQALQIGQGVSSLVAHDVDSDGRIDLAVANALSGAIGILRTGAGTSFKWTRVSRVRAPTLLLMQDVNRDGIQDLVTIDVEGRDVWMFAGDGAARSWDPYMVDSSGIADIIDASLMTHVPLTGPRLTSVVGDGQARQGGLSAREPLVVEVRDLTGAVSAGETVSFSRLAGRAEVLGSDALGSAASARVTDERGQALLDLLLPRLPDATVMVASLAPDQIAPFRIISYLQNEEIAGLIATALAEEIGDARALRIHRTWLRDAVRQLERGDSLAATRDLMTSVDHLEGASSASTPARTNSAASLTRRFLAQILLMGPSPEVPDDEPIVCDVPLTRTIESATEVDRFRFDGVPSERVHITLGNEGGTGMFNPAWRLMAPDGIPVVGCATFTGADRDCALVAAGVYAIEVEDFSFDGTGTYSLQLQRLTAGQRCGAATIACDVVATNTIDVRVDTDLHEFTGVAGERLHVTVGKEAGGALFAPMWRLVAPDGTLVVGCSVFTTAERDCTLAVAGAHAIEVADNLNDGGTGTYSLQIQRLTASERCGATTIACDVVATNTIDARVDTDLHEFIGVAGERLHVTVGKEAGGVLFAPMWRLVAPDGTLVAGCSVFTTAERDCTVAVAGAHAIEVADNLYDGGTGTYSLQIQRLTASQRCVVTTITCDVVATNTIDALVDTDLHEFTSVAGERLHVTVAKEAGGVLFAPMWRLVAPDGTLVAGCNTFALGERDCTLVVAGAHAIEVEDNLNDGGTGTYSLQVQRLTASERCGTVIACDVPETTTISALSDTDLHQFNGMAGELLHVTIGGTIGSFNPQWRLIAPNGSGVAGCDTFTTGGRDCSLPPGPVCAPSNGCSFAGEPYAIEVEDGGFNATGTYSLHIQRLKAPLRCGVMLLCDVGATTTISASADTDIFELNGHQDEQVHITISGAGGAFNPQWRLLAPDGTGVTGCDTFSGAARDCTLPVGGAYAIEVQDSGFDATGTYQLTTASSLQVCPPLDGIGPAVIATRPVVLEAASKLAVSVQFKLVDQLRVSSDQLILPRWVHKIDGKTTLALPRQHDNPVLKQARVESGGGSQAI